MQNEQKAGAGTASTEGTDELYRELTGKEPNKEREAKRAKLRGHIRKVFGDSRMGEVYDYSNPNHTGETFSVVNLTGKPLAKGDDLLLAMIHDEGVVGQTYPLPADIAGEGATATLMEHDGERYLCIGTPEMDAKRHSSRAEAKTERVREAHGGTEAELDALNDLLGGF